MQKPVIAIASDHAGVALKASVKEMLAEFASEVVDLGTQGGDSVDYPDYADAVAGEVLAGRAAYGIAICGSGIGMSIAANRHKGIRAALCMDGLTAQLSRRHNDANVLCLGARLIGVEVARDCIKQFLTTPFEGGRHEKRLKKMDS
jgi:ribose 5-phosphate isomerase B